MLTPVETDREASAPDAEWARYVATPMTPMAPGAVTPIRAKQYRPTSIKSLDF